MKPREFWVTEIISKGPPWATGGLKVHTREPEWSEFKLNGGEILKWHVIEKSALDAKDVEIKRLLEALKNLSDALEKINYHNPANNYSDVKALREAQSWAKFKITEAELARL